MLLIRAIRVRLVLIEAAEQRGHLMIITRAPQLLGCPRGRLTWRTVRLGDLDLDFCRWKASKRRHLSVVR
jgi:hypothetical protein